MLVIHQNGLITGLQSFPETTTAPHIEVDDYPASLHDAVGLVSLVENSGTWELPSAAVIQAAIDAHSDVRLQSDARAERDRRINIEMWRYERIARETRLGLTPTDDIAALDSYIQALANVPDQDGFPHSINWPVLS